VLVDGRFGVIEANQRRRFDRTGGIEFGNPDLVQLAHAFGIRGEAVTVETTGRHDPCVGIRATPIAEAMLACILMDHALRHRAQCADVILPTKLEKPRKIN